MAASGPRPTGEVLRARFTFTLPAVAETGVDVPVPGRASRRRAASLVEEQVRVLAVGGDPQTLPYVRNILAGACYRLVVSGDMEEALHLMHRWSGIVIKSRPESLKKER